VEKEKSSMPVVTSLFRSVMTLPPNQSCGLDAPYAAQNFRAASFNDAVCWSRPQLLLYSDGGGLPFRALMPFGSAEYEQWLEGAKQ
jgi:hypothetical protein